MKDGLDDTCIKIDWYINLRCIKKLRRIIFFKFIVLFSLLNITFALLYTRQYLLPKIKFNFKLLNKMYNFGKLVSAPKKRQILKEFSDYIVI